MKKSNKKKRQPSSKRKPQSPTPPVRKDRRAVLSRIATFAVAALVVGGVGFWGVRTVQASLAEQDLTKLGQGKPMIVQVHDAQCSTCIALQREARAALEQVDEADLGYLVADIKTETGLMFASRYGAQHSTLLFFDGAGRLTNQLVGPNNRATLAEAFLRHAGS